MICQLTGRGTEGNNLRKLVLYPTELRDRSVQVIFDLATSFTKNFTQIPQTSSDCPLVHGKITGKFWDETQDH